MNEQTDILATCLLRIDTEGVSALEDCCREHPDHAQFLREKVGDLIGLGLVAENSLVADNNGEPTEMPQQIGAYRIVSVLGHGGMGTVFLGEQSEPIQRRVAIKVVKLGMDSRRVIARFELERRTLAMMSHPAIAIVIEAGITDTGRPFFVMEHVAGVPLTKHCDDRRLDIGERLELFVQACHAVQHAHHKGMLHRDLKPSNILAQESEGGHALKLIDFGLARAMSADAEHSLLTVAGTLVGTPEYMSPEQAGGEDADARTDIYSLGVVLYELLTGSLPFDHVNLRQQSLAAIVRTIQEVEPPSPGARLRCDGESISEHATRRRSSPKQLARQVQGELDWIVQKAIAKEPDRRYASAADLARDVQRYLAGEAVEAGPPSATYRLKKLVLKYRVQAVAIVVVFCTAIAGALLADAGRRAANRELARFDGLAVFADLETAKREAAALVPAWPEAREKLRLWTERYGEAIPAKIAVARALLATLEATHLSGAGFDDQADAILFGALSRGRDDLIAFASTTLADVERRVLWAERIEQLTHAHPNARVRWSEAHEAIAAADGDCASTLYAEHAIDLRPHLGLVPIGMNPATKLWEFYHLRSAMDFAAGGDPEDIEIPRHRPDGSIEMTDDTGIVFVLVPGGTALLGSQDEDANAPNYYRDAHIWTKPMHHVALAPFFLARHETTQGQWFRLTGGENPSRSKPGKHWQGNPGPTTWYHPVEQVSWTMARDVLSRHGMVLPTEAQWEFACRAGTDALWYTGADPSSLAGYENIADATFAQNGGIHSANFDDGWGLGSSPVGTYRANPFGLFDMLGNMNEWCQDRFGNYHLPVALDTGERLVVGPHTASTRHVTRGGSAICKPHDAHCALRSIPLPTEQNYYLGVRASRALDLSR